MRVRYQRVSASEIRIVRQSGFDDSKLILLIFIPKLCWHSSSLAPSKYFRCDEKNGIKNQKHKPNGYRPLKGIERNNRKFIRDHRHRSAAA